jgi:hypothetical protein
MCAQAAHETRKKHGYPLKELACSNRRALKLLQQHLCDFRASLRAIKPLGRGVDTRLKPRIVRPDESFKWGADHSPPRSANEITLSTHSMPASVLVSSLVEQQQTHARSECDAGTPLAIHAADAIP